VSLAPAVRVGRPLRSSHPVRFRSYIALLTGDVWGLPERERTGGLGLTQGEAVTGNLPLIKALTLRLSTGRKTMPGPREGILALRPDRLFQADLRRVRGTLGIERVWALGARGRGVTVGLVDSGVHPHPDLVSPINRSRASAISSLAV
jgi:hypothetical protein